MNYSYGDFVVPIGTITPEEYFIGPREVCENPPKPPKYFCLFLNNTVLYYTALCYIALHCTVLTVHCRPETVKIDLMVLVIFENLFVVVPMDTTKT